MQNSKDDLNSRPTPRPTIKSNTKNKVVANSHKDISWSKQQKAISLSKTLNNETKEVTLNLNNIPTLTTTIR